jgi:hypothetical protein
MASSNESGLDVLARDERGFAGAWVKRYVRDPGAGFFFLVRPTLDDAALRQLAFIAEYWPR